MILTIMIIIRIITVKIAIIIVIIVYVVDMMGARLNQINDNPWNFLPERGEKK